MEVADATNGYRLTLGTFLGGDVGDALLFHNDMMFSAKDLDRDAWHGKPCTELNRGGFWYKSCLQWNPTGKYYTGGEYTADVSNGIQWRS